MNDERERRRAGGHKSWQVPGPYVGVGPRNYRRSPERMREEVEERLAQHGHLDATDIEVQVDDQGEVTLQGSVRRRADKRLAEDVAEAVAGVRDVHNHLRVMPVDNQLTQSQEGGEETRLTRWPPPRPSRKAYELDQR